METPTSDKSSGRILSYCVPVMNRMNDLEATLEHNLRTLGPFKDRVDIHIACFDTDDSCQKWVMSRFTSEIAAGLLHFHRLPPLPHWHFCWAKNAFKNLLSSRYYSSLDGDNFLHPEEVRQTLSLISDQTEQVLIHHFSGDWGDGTSGRVTMPANIYREIGYLDRLFPRQFDEMSLLMHVLIRYPRVQFISQEGVDIFAKSNACRDFLLLNDLKINRRQVKFDHGPAPLLPRGIGYVEKDPKLLAYQRLNLNYSLLEVSSTVAARKKFSSDLLQAQREIGRSDVALVLFKSMFSGPGVTTLVCSGVPTVYAVVKDDEFYLRKWYEHYRSLGVRRFIIVDDNSGEPVEKVLPFGDVHIVRPLVGEFKTFKVFWLKTLMRCCQEDGSWALTVDSDEFLDLGASTDGSPFESAVRNAEAEGRRYIVGLMLDMMPRDTGVPIDERNFVDEMSAFYFRPVNNSYNYQDIPAIRWAFGEEWRLSFAVDVRFRLFGTIDCLRKFAAFRFSANVDLNQGFHALYIDGIEIPVSEVYARRDTRIYPIRHYKMYKVLAKGFDASDYARRLGKYHDRTQQNLVRILSQDPNAIRKSWRLTPFKRQYAGPDSFWRPLAALKHEQEAIA